MSDYQTQFDQSVQAANDAVATRQSELSQIVPNLLPSQIRRLIGNISTLLGHVDRRDIFHPEYLAGSPRNVPERAIELIATVAPSFDSGSEHFVQNVLPQLVDVERRLMEAVGTSAFNVQKIKNQQIKALDRIQANATTVYSRSYKAMENVEASAKTSQGTADELKAILALATSDNAKIAEIRKLSEKLSKGNAGQNPLEALVRAAREKSEEIDQIAKRASASADAAEASAKSATACKTQSADALEGLESSNEKADQILRNATQAGLAGAYKTERDKLALEQNRYALTFYGTIILIILYAAIFLLPIFRDLLGLNGGTTSARDSALILLVRLLILTPIAWALIFTNGRYRYLETLQMDYAAKSTTALAYAGYIDEVEADPELAKRLKDGLVLRFLEHPSRLLGKKQEIDKSMSGPDGVTVESTSVSSSVANAIETVLER